MSCYLLHHSVFLTHYSIFSTNLIDMLITYIASATTSEVSHRIPNILNSVDG